MELPAPDAAVRERVLARELEAKLGTPDPELAAYLAARPADSIGATQALLERVLETATARGVPPGAAFAREVIELPRPPARRRRRRRRRSSGIVAAGAGAARSREKMVWEWPGVGDRVIEDGADGDQGQPQGGESSGRHPAPVPRAADGMLALADRHNFGTVYFEEGHIVYAAIVNAVIAR